MIYLNNKLVRQTRAVISVFDHGFLYGDGVYETLRVYKGIVFEMNAHLERLFNSASMIGLNIPKTPQDIRESVYKTLRANRHEDAVIRITVSRGVGPLGLDTALCPDPTFVIMSHEFNPYPGHYYRRGVKISIVNTRRNYSKALDPRIKSLSFLNNILAKREAKERDAQEAIMLNYRGRIAEGTVSNIFFMKNDTLCTPSLSVGILGGITRSIVLDIAEANNIQINEGQFTPEDILRAREVFISNTTMEVMPVSEIDEVKITDAPGRVTKRLALAYKKKVAAYLIGAE